MRGAVRPLVSLGRFVIAVTATFAVLGLASAAGASVPSHSPSSPRAALASTSAAPTAAMVQDSARLGNTLSSDFPTTFGGLTVSGAGITVYTTHVPKGLARAVDAVVPASMVLYARSTHTLGAIDAIHRDLAASWLALQNEGVDIVGFQPDVATSTEQIQIIAPTASQITMLDQRYPSDAISVVSVAEAPIPQGFVARIDAESHAGLPSGFGWVFGILALLGVALTVGVVLHARWPRVGHVASVASLTPPAPAAGLPRPNPDELDRVHEPEGLAPSDVPVAAAIAVA